MFLFYHKIFYLSVYNLTRTQLWNRKISQWSIQLRLLSTCFFYYWCVAKSPSVLQAVSEVSQQNLLSSHLHLLRAVGTQLPGQRPSPIPLQPGWQLECSIPLAGPRHTRGHQPNGHAIRSERRIPWRPYQRVPAGRVEEGRWGALPGCYEWFLCSGKNCGLHIEKRFLIIMFTYSFTKDK